MSNGKYEFCRLPFGLKNAPLIFQRALDDILRDQIGKCFYIYIDDVIIFSPDQETHYKDIKCIIKLLYDANMRLSREKSSFFQSSIEYLGFLVTKNGITTCNDKVEAINKFPTPKTVKELRSFLGLSNYYRRFIKDYAAIAKPLTSILRGSIGQISSKKSGNTSIIFNIEADNAFKQIKNILSSDVILLYPKYDKPYELATDASNFTI